MQLYLIDTSVAVVIERKKQTIICRYAYCASVAAKFGQLRQLILFFDPKYEPFSEVCSIEP